MSITICSVSGNVQNLLGSNVQACNVVASVLSPFFHSGTTWISGQLASTTTDSSGNFTLAVVETATPGQKMNFTFDYYDGVSGRRTKSYAVVVPNQASANLSDLVSLNAPTPSASTYPAAHVTVSAISGLTATNAQAAFAELVGNRLLSALTSTYIFVGNSSNVATGVVVSGDLTNTNTGVFTIANSAVTNAKIAAAAGISYSKLALTGAILNADLAGSITAAKLVGTDIATVGTVTSGTWNGTRIAAGYGGTGADLSAATGVVKVSSGTFSAASLVNADVSASAAIAYSKLALTGAILNGDLAGSIAASKLVGTDIATVGTITSGTWNATAIARNKVAAGTATYVPYNDGSTGLLTEDSNLAWDGTNHHLNIGGAASDFPLNIKVPASGSAVTEWQGNNASNNKWQWSITDGAGSQLYLDNAHTSLAPFAALNTGEVAFGSISPTPGIKARFFGHPNGAIVALNNNSAGPGNQVTGYASDGSTVLWSVDNAGNGTFANAVAAATASTIMARDSSANARINSLISGYATTATAAATTTLTVASAHQQFFTGSTTQTVQLPAASALVLGQQFNIVNNSSGVVTIKDAGSNTLQAMAASSSALVTVTNIGSSNGVWNIEYAVASAGGGTVTSVAAAGPTGIATWSSAVTTAGTLTQTLSNQNASTVLAGPTNGSSATTPAFRQLDTRDIPLNSATGSGGGTLTNTSDYVQATPSAATPITFTLPAANTVKKPLYFTKSDSDTTSIITIARAGSDVIVDPTGASVTSIQLNTQYDSVTLLSDQSATYTIVASKVFRFLSSAPGNYSFSSLGANDGRFATAGCTVTLTPGTWRLTGKLGINVGTTTTAGVLSGTGFYGADGANTTSTPTALGGTISGDVTFASQSSIYAFLDATFTATNSRFQAGLLSVIVKVTSSTAVYFVPKLDYGTAGNGTVTPYLQAERIF